MCLMMDVIDKLYTCDNVNLYVFVNNVDVELSFCLII